MSIRKRSERAVDSSLRRLEDEYGGLDVVEKTWEHPQDQYRAIAERFEDETLGGAGVWVTNESGDVLLVRNDGEDGWGDPGGKVEVGETFEEAAIRETREETGIECELTGLCEVHVIRNRNTEDEDPEIVELIVIFHGTKLDGAPRPQEGEIAEVGWFSTPPETALYPEIRDRPYPASE